MRNRILSRMLVLTLIVNLCLSFFPIRVARAAGGDPPIHIESKVHYGPYTDGSGTKNDPYILGNADDLLDLWDEVDDGNLYEGVYFKLNWDINLKSYCGKNIGDWDPIGSKYFSFMGNLDGAGHTISGLYIGNGGEDVGLFGVVGSEFKQGGEIKNLNVSGEIHGKNNVGGIIGKSYANVENCSFSGSVTGTGNNVGGIAGLSYGSIIDCMNNGMIKAEGHYAGGIVGQTKNDYKHQVFVQTSKNYGDVDAEQCAGGIVGYTLHPVRQCANFGKVTAVMLAGEIIGTGNSSLISSTFGEGSPVMILILTGVAVVLLVSVALLIKRRKKEESSSPTE